MKLGLVGFGRQKNGNLRDIIKKVTTANSARDNAFGAVGCVMSSAGTPSGSRSARREDLAVSEMNELAGSVTLVTGAARNIGRAIAVALGAGGASVMVNANTSREAAEQTVAMIEEAGGTAELYLADVSDPDAVHRMVDATVERFGRLDILVNNAAIRAETPLAEIDLAEWRKVMGVILEGSFLCSQACAPHIAAAGGGTIINLGGQTGHTGAANRAHVVAAKAGLVGLTKGLALELAPQRITVNLVVPGTIDTVRGLPGAPERPPERQAVPPIGRRGYPEDVASMVRLLCGPGGRYITGQTVHINGGGSMF